MLYAEIAAIAAAVDVEVDLSVLVPAVAMTTSKNIKMMMEKTNESEDNKIQRKRKTRIQ